MRDLKFQSNKISNNYWLILEVGKVEKILKGSLDSILSPPPSVKIQIVGGKICSSCVKKIGGFCGN